MAGQLSTAVVICCFTEDRWRDLNNAYASLRAQTVPPESIVIVVDHNDALYDRVLAGFEGVVVVRNGGPRGLSGARNEGVNEASGSQVVLFLDDDAVAEESWIERMVKPFGDERVAAVSGFAEPAWDAPGRPGWFPDEFLWVVGCSHRGLPDDGAVVRNPIGCAMAFRTTALARAGSFSTALGRVGAKPIGCEETDLALRLIQRNPGARVVLARRARVHHRVPFPRQSFSYFLRRCYGEGVSKATVTQRHRGAAPLRTERQFVIRLGQAVARAAAGAIRERDGLRILQAGAIVVGLAATVIGYLVGRLMTLRQGMSAVNPAPSWTVAG